MQYTLVEKHNHSAVHGYFDSKDRADMHLKKKMPEYVQKGFFTDKSLTAESFVVIKTK